jgi:uncharacterized protein YaiI (UPF0178 family)
MPIYVTESGEFSTKIAGDLEIVEEMGNDCLMSADYAIAGAIVDECASIMKYGIVYDQEYISKEAFCDKIKNNPRLGSNLVLRLLQEDAKNFAPFGAEDDLTITAKIIEIK